MGEINLAVSTPTVKPPNFRLYSTSWQWIIHFTGSINSGGSRILKRGVTVCDLNARRAPARAWKIWNFWPSEIVFGVLFGWKLDNLLLNLAAVLKPTKLKAWLRFGPLVSRSQTLTQKAGESGSARLWGRRGCKSAGYPCKSQENKRSHTDSISPFLAAEGEMHEQALIRSLASLIVSMVTTCFW